MNEVQEFEKLEPSNTVYKLVGPILMKQDQDEAKSNVQKRLEWITGEMCVWLDCLQCARSRTDDQPLSQHSERTEKALKQEQGRIEGKKMEVRCHPHRLRVHDLTASVLWRAARRLPAADAGAAARRPGSSASHCMIISFASYTSFDITLLQGYPASCMTPGQRYSSGSLRRRGRLSSLDTALS